MPKRSAKCSSQSAPDWKTRWPRNGDLKAWMRCMLKKCDAIVDDEAAADKAHLPIQQLASMGESAEALRHLNRYLRRLPSKSVVETVRAAEVGAEICLNANDLTRMEKYLATAEATEPYNSRKCDKGFSINSVRDFRADHGLLNPEDAIDDQQRLKARFRKAEREFAQALATRKRKAAKLAAAKMEEAAEEQQDYFFRQMDYRTVLECYAKLSDTAAVKRCIRRLGKEDRDEVLDPDTFLKLGMKPQAIARAKRHIAQELEELAESDDPNSHFPVMSICHSLQFLVEHGEKNSAKRWLRRALKEMPTWPGIEIAWIASGVFNSFAEIAARVEGAAAAEQLLQKTIKAAEAVSQQHFRQGAISGALDLKSHLNQLDEAIADARKLRAPTVRRRELSKLLARARRWKELREVLSEAASPAEAADLVWLIKSGLPGGEAP